MYETSLIRLKRDIYQPEPWTRHELLFHKGETVPVIKADNLPSNSSIKFWIDLPDPRIGENNAYGFGLGIDDIV